MGDNLYLVCGFVHSGAVQRKEVNMFLVMMLLAYLDDMLARR